MSVYIDRCIELSEQDHEDANTPSWYSRKLEEIYMDHSESGRVWPANLWKPKVIEGAVIGRAVYFAKDILKITPGGRRVSILKDPTWFDESMPELKLRLRSSISLLRTEILEMNPREVVIRYGVFGFKEREKWGPYVDYILVRGDETKEIDIPALEWAALWAG